MSHFTPLNEHFAHIFGKATPETLSAKKRAMESAEDDIDAAFADDSYIPELDEPQLPELYDGR